MKVSKRSTYSKIEEDKEKQLRNIDFDLEEYSTALNKLNTKFLGGVTTTQTFKDGSGATKTLHITSGLITSIT